MKYLLLLSFLMLSGRFAFSQDSISTVPDPALKERIIELAMKNKSMEIADHQVQIAKYDLKRSKRWWLDEISLSFNANEFTIKRFQKSGQSGGDSRYSYYPLYNFGLNIPIGRVFTKSMSVKSAREQVEISEALRDDQAIDLRSHVLVSYQDFVQNRRLYTLQLKSTEAVFNDFLQAKQKFKTDQISLEEYNNASRQYDAALKSKVIAEHDYQLSKITFERLIGISVEELLSNFK